MEKKMEFRMKNWNKILNNFIASFAIVIVSLVIGLGFISPKNYAVALTKEDIKDYNIYFVSALTKSREATGMNRMQLEGLNPNNETYDFYTYQYDYKDFSESEWFYGKSGNVIEDYSNEKTTTTSDANELIFAPLSSNLDSIKSTGFIPYGVNYFTNQDGLKQEIFYNEIDNGDYVLLDNYSNHNSVVWDQNQENTFNVENFYLSFGTPYIDDTETTPIYDLEIQGRLYSEGQTHFLALNEVNRTMHSNKYVNYWYQYFDLRSLEAYRTNDPNADKYTIENQQGKYEITFLFSRYDKNLEPQDTARETFTYTFYLLDSTEYSNYPTIYNSTIEGGLDGISDLTELSDKFSDFAAVKSGNVWCTDASTFQRTTGAADMIVEMNRIFAGTADDSGMEYFHRLN
jgi:hypothetical protein